MKGKSDFEFGLKNTFDYSIAYALPQVVFEFDQQGNIVFVNRNAFKVFGYNEEDFVKGLNIFQILVPDDWERARSNISLRMSGKEQLDNEFTVRRKDGSSFPVIVNINQVINQDGALGLVGILIDITERKSIEEKLRESENRLQNQVNYLNTLIENMNEAFFTYDLQGVITFANKKATEYIGYLPEEMAGKSLLDFVHPDQREMVAQKIKTLLREGVLDSYEIMILHKDGEPRFIKLNSSPILEDGEIAGGMMVGEDVTKRRQVEDALKVSEQRQSDIINFLPDPTFVINLEGQVIAWNRAMEDMTGVKAEDILGRGDYKHALSFYDDRRPMLADLLIRPDKKIEKLYDNLKRENDTLVAEGDGWVLHSSGSRREAYLWVKASPLYDSQGKIAGVIETIRDITERRQTEDQLRYLILHDSLTGLYNRTYFEEEMRRLGSGRYNPVGIVVCDVNGLKLVNDTRGHDAGDALLTAAAGVLRKCFRENDTVARIGGDEFAILLPQSPQTLVESAGARIKAAIVSYNSEHPELPLSISIGLAASDKSPPNMADLFKEADNQMYRQKLEGSRTARNALVHSLMNEVVEKWSKE